MDPSQRPSAAELLSHPFIQRSIRLGYIDPPNPPSLVLPEESIIFASSKELDDMVFKLIAW